MSIPSIQTKRSQSKKKSKIKILSSNYNTNKGLYVVQTTKGWYLIESNNGENEDFLSAIKDKRAEPYRPTQEWYGTLTW